MVVVVFRICFRFPFLAMVLDRDESPNLSLSDVARRLLRACPGHGRATRLWEPATDADVLRATLRRDAFASALATAAGVLRGTLGRGACDSS